MHPNPPTARSAAGAGVSRLALWRFFAVCPMGSVGRAPPRQQAMGHPCRRRGTAAWASALSLTLAAPTWAQPVDPSGSDIGNVLDPPWQLGEGDVALGVLALFLLIITGTFIAQKYFCGDEDPEGLQEVLGATGGGIQDDVPERYKRGSDDYRSSRYDSEAAAVDRLER